MNKEKSCGAIVYYLEDEVPFYLVIQHVNGDHWAFAKGHVEDDETEKETALREIQEETKMSKITLDTHFRETTEYSPKENVIKEVIYFVAKATKEEAQSVKAQEQEVKNFKWLSIKKATDLLTYDNDKTLLKKAHHYLVN